MMDLEANLLFSYTEGLVKSLMDVFPINLAGPEIPSKFRHTSASLLHATSSMYM